MAIQQRPGGYTRTYIQQGVPFKSVCEAIGQAVTPKSWPVLVSLECNVDVEEQRELVKEMMQAWVISW